MLETMINAFSGPGSAFMYAITAILAFGMAIAVERVWLFWVRWRVDGDAMLARLTAGDVAEAVKLAGDSPPGRVLRAGADAPDVDRAWDAMGAEAALVEATVRQRVPYLATVGNISTMLGLLGTVYGLILAFTALGDASAAERAARLSEGIATAMSTTAWGLLVGIPALAVHALLEGKAARLLALCEATAARLASLKRG